MNASTAPALYRLADRRADGTPRELQRFADPDEARAAAEALVAAGADVTLELVPTTDPLVPGSPA